MICIQNAAPQVTTPAIPSAPAVPPVTQCTRVEIGCYNMMKKCEIVFITQKTHSFLQEDPFELETGERVTGNASDNMGKYFIQLQEIFDNTEFYIPEEEIMDVFKHLAYIGCVLQTTCFSKTLLTCTDNKEQWTEYRNEVNLKLKAVKVQIKSC